MKEGINIGNVLLISKTLGEILLYNVPHVNKKNEVILNVKQKIKLLNENNIEYLKNTEIENYIIKILGGINEEDIEEIKKVKDFFYLQINYKLFLQ